MPKQSILVIGDIIHDTYIKTISEVWRNETNSNIRICDINYPPIIELGGAGYVARTLCNLGYNVELIGYNDINTPFVKYINSRNNTNQYADNIRYTNNAVLQYHEIPFYINYTNKVRIINEKDELVYRYDYSAFNPNSSNFLRESIILETLNTKLSSIIKSKVISCCILCDYADSIHVTDCYFFMSKPIIKTIYDICKMNNIPVIIDTNYRYRTKMVFEHADIIKLNENTLNKTINSFQSYIHTDRHYTIVDLEKVDLMYRIKMFSQILTSHDFFQPIENKLLHNIVITCGDNGSVLMQLYKNVNNFDVITTHIPVMNVCTVNNYVSTVGCGDTMTACMAVELSKDKSALDNKDKLIHLLEKASIGANLATTKKLTLETIFEEEYLTQCAKHINTNSYKIINSKIVSCEEADKIISAWRDEGYQIVFANGCFDWLHYGHLAYLNFSKQINNTQTIKLVVAVNSDEYIRRVKGYDRPLFSFNERAHMLAALEVVSLIVKQEENHPITLINRFKPEHILRGEEYKEEDLQLVSNKNMLQVLEDIGQVYYVPRVGNYSTSAHFNKLCNT